MRVVYGDLVIDTARLTVTADGVDVHVQPQVFDVLAHLLEHRDRVVTKEELLDEIWGDRFVSESALTSRIKSARQLVGDDGISQRAIKTIHGRGYRWVADVRDDDAAANGVHGTDRDSPDAGPPALPPPPRPLTKLIGRDQEIASIRAASELHRLVTLTGPPGVGKSRLAVEFVADSSDRSDGEVAFVDLRPAADHREVLAAFRRAVRVPGTPGPVDDNVVPDDARAVDALVDHLRRRHVRLLVDNCEHVVESVAQLCATVLVGCPGVSILATSRRSLGLGGEFVVPVEPMPLPTTASSWDELIESDAGRLLVDRAHAAGARWNDDPGQVELAATLCRRLDGLPLAIELAAARARRLSLHDLVQQFTHELAFEGGVAPSDGPLAVALRSSRAQLPADARRAFDAMSVFSSSFTIEAALSVIGTVCPTADALATFEMLIDHSLVDVITGSRHRYRMLETVQRFAETCRHGWAEPEVAVLAHFDHYLRFVEKRWPVGLISTATPWSTLAAEKTEIMTAIRRAAARDPRRARQLVGSLGWFWWIDGDTQLWDELFPALDATVDEDPDEIAAPFAWTQAIAKLLVGLDPVPFALAAVERGRRAGQWSVAAWALAFSVAPDMMWIELDRVSERWDEIVELFRRHDDTCGEAWAMVYVLGYAQSCAQQHPAAAATYQTAASLFERCGDALGVARALIEIVELDIWTGYEPAQARAIYDTIPQADDLPIESWMKLQWLGGLIAEAEGDHELAVRLHERALETSERHLPAALLTNTYRCLTASVLRRVGRRRAAVGLFLEVLDFAATRRSFPGWNRHAPWVLESVAGLLLDAGLAARAAEIFGAASRLRDELDAPMPYWDERRFSPDDALARGHLGEQAFAEAVALGRQRDLDETFRLLTEDLRALGAPIGDAEPGTGPT